MKEGEPNPPTLFDQLNEYLRKEAPKDIENPTIQGIAEGMGIPQNILNHWLANDREFIEGLTRLRDFFESDPLKDGTYLDYLTHSFGIHFLLDETKKRHTF